MDDGDLWFIGLIFLVMIAVGGAIAIETGSMPDAYIYKTASGGVGIAKHCYKRDRAPLVCYTDDGETVEPESYRGVTKEEIKIIKEMYGGEE